MKTVRQLLYRDVFWSVFFVTVAFVALFFFIDFVDEMSRVGHGGYTAKAAALATLLEQPGHVYELFPIAVLIGTIYSMARLAQSSEFTILRTAGLGPGRALSLLGVIGLLFAVLTFGLGEYVTPHSEQAAAFLKARFGMGLAVGRTGAWLKEHRTDPDGERSVTVNVRGVGKNGELTGVRIWEMNDAGREVRGITAEHAVVGRGRTVREWTLENATQTLWDTGAATSAAAPASAASGATAPTVRVTHLDQMSWPTRLNASVAAAAVLPINSMGALDLWRYSTHLAAQEQASQTYRMQFWKRVLYPFACLVMVALALPFAYLHARAGGVSVKVFGGIMLGISFVLLNNVVGHLGQLHDWTPWIAASVPSVVYLLLSMSAFAWLVRYR
ncbi:MAG TPA: LPS export ABC transporter permease LptG [Burkholderiaceae bacterium]